MNRFPWNHHARRGLTLVELLAALVILSAVSAAGVSILRESTAAARRASLLLDAMAVLEQWEQETHAEKASVESTSTWLWTDAAGRHWRVREDQAEGPFAAAASLDGPGEESSAPIELNWREIVVEVALDEAAGGFEEALRRKKISRTPSEEPEEAP